MSRKSEPIDYMDLIARTAEEEHEEDWTDTLPEPQGEKAVDYMVVSKAWEKEKERMMKAEEIGEK